MKYRKLGNTDMLVSEVGLGAGGRIGFPETPDSLARAQFHLALDLGINFIDTGSNYSMGNSERRIGRFLKGRRSDFFLATKCGSRLIEKAGEGVDVKRDFTRQGVLGCIEESLSRLQTDYVDLIQFHTPPESALKKGSEAIEGLQEAVSKGMARYIGISVDGPRALQALSLGCFQALQISYSVVMPEAAEKVLPAAREAGVGVIVKEPLANAFYTGRPRPDEDYDYQIPAWERAQQYTFLNDYQHPSATEIALRYVLDHPAVSTAIPASVNPDHLRANTAVSDMAPLEQALLDRIHEAENG